MIIDFTRIEALIPQEGSVTFTIKRTKEGGELVVLYTAKHNLKKVSSTYEKSLEGDKKAIEEATVQLNRTIPLRGLPQKLTETFEEAIKGNLLKEKALAELITERTDTLNAAIEALKNRKPAKASTLTKTAEPKVDKKLEEGGAPAEKNTPDAEGGLFGGTLFATVSAPAAKGPETSEPGSESDGDSEEVE